MPYLIAPSIDQTLTFMWPVKKTPRFNSIVQTPASGRGELSIPLYQFPLWKFKWVLGYIPGDFTETNSVIQQLINFFMGVQGRGSPFLFKDPYDYQVTNQNIGTGDGSTAQFTMYRSLVVGGAQDLIQNFITPPTIKVAGVTQTVVTDYNIDQYGTLTFAPGHIPTAGQAIMWTGQFMFLCRFSSDSFTDLEESMYQLWKISSFEFESILL